MGESKGKKASGASRRSLFVNASRVAMFGGLAAGYGLFGAMAGRFMFPPSRREDRWTFVTELDGMSEGESRSFRTPGGLTLSIARLASNGTAKDFIALSSTCPHLGCRVFWEPQNSRFYCPCHNGAFDPQGKPTEGPVKEANQELQRFPLKVEKGILYMELPYEINNRAELIPDEPEGPVGPGHDPCLQIQSRGNRKA